MSKRVKLLLVFIGLFLVLLLVAIMTSKHNRELISEKFENITRKKIEPTWDYPKWVIDECKSSEKNPYMRNMIYRCEKDLFSVGGAMVDSGFWYVDYNGKRLTKNCHEKEALCEIYDRKCKISKTTELVCHRGHIEIITNGEKYRKGGTVKINYNIVYVHDERDSVFETVVEKLSDKGNWEKLELLETKSIDGYFDKKINFILEWSGKTEGTYRIVATGDLFENLSNCNKKSGKCSLKRFYSNEFVVSSNENLD